MSLVVLRASDPREREAWLALWREWPAREPFAHPGYVERFVGEGQQGLCAVWHSDAGKVMMPLVLRPLDVGVDLTTPYGYGGPFAWGEPDGEAFWDAFDAWAVAQGAATLFARLSLFSETMVPWRGERARSQDNVVRTLDLDGEATWMDYEHKVRKNIKKAERGGLTVEWDLTGARLAEFHAVYLDTMVRREAAAGYHFPLSFFEALLRDLPGEVAFVHAMLNGEVASTELVLVGATHTYSFLGGTVAEAFALRPNDLLKHAIIDWSRAQGKQAFVLGGGYAPDDGIFRYKKAFAPEGVVPFYVGRRTYDEARAAELVARRRAAEPGWLPAEGFFPEYRAPNAKGV